MKKLLFPFFLFFFSIAVHAQCELAFDEYDDFDSTRVVAAEVVSVGYLVPSKFETLDGPKLVEEAKLLFSFSESDSISSFFLTLAALEYEYFSIQNGTNVMLRLEGGEVLGLYNIPDRGSFDKGTNMRVYLHTCVVPVDMFYKLTNKPVEMIRIEYKSRKRTIKLSKEQQQAFMEAVKCVGLVTPFLPVEP